MFEATQATREGGLEAAPTHAATAVATAAIAESQKLLVLDVKDLSFAWPASSLRIQITDLQVHASEHWLLEGASGSGKSSLLQLLEGVLLPQQGDVRILGQSWSALSAEQRDTGSSLTLGDLMPDVLAD